LFNVAAVGKKTNPKAEGFDAMMMWKSLPCSFHGRIQNPIGTRSARTSLRIRKRVYRRSLALDKKARAPLLMNAAAVAETSSLCVCVAVASLRRCGFGALLSPLSVCRTVRIAGG